MAGSSSPEEAVDWVALLQTFGLAVVILLFLGWCAVKASPWVAALVNKFVDRSLAAADKVEAFEDRLVKLEQRLDNLWDFQLRRASVEALQRGIGKMNSPLILSEEAKSWMAELAAELKTFYRRFGRTLSVAQLAEEIERRYGDEIVKKVCIPHGLFQGACLLIAMEVAREVDREVEKDVVPGLPPVLPPLVSETTK
jgi:hypothetical protein